MAILLHPFGAERVGRGAHGDDEVVVFEGELVLALQVHLRHVLAHHHLVLRVDLDALGLVELHVLPVASHDPPYGLNDAPGFHASRSHAWEQRCEHKIVPRRNHAHIVEGGIQVLEETHASPSRPEHDHPLLPRLTCSKLKHM